MEAFFIQALDYLANSGVGISIIISFVTLAIYAHLIVVQTYETIQIRDFLQRYRVYILTFLVISFCSIIPVTYYLVLRYFGIQDEDLRNFATVCARLGPLAQALAFEMIYFYRRKRGE